MHIDKSKLVTDWLENEAGDKWPVDFSTLGGPPTPPPGYDYWHSLGVGQLSHEVMHMASGEAVARCLHNPKDIRPTDGWVDGIKGRKCLACGGTQAVSEVSYPGNTWPEKWQAGGSSMLAKSTTTYSDDLVLALANSGEYTLSQAILVVARACERCLNVLYHKYLPEKDPGYAEGSPQWLLAGTKCDFCDDIKVVLCIDLEHVERRLLAQLLAALPEGQGEHMVLGSDRVAAPESTVLLDVEFTPDFKLSQGPDCEDDLDDGVRVASNVVQLEKLLREHYDHMECPGRCAECSRH